MSRVALHDAHVREHMALLLAEKVWPRCEDEGDCLLWRGYIGNGSPQLRLPGRYVQLRRLVWQAAHGAIRSGLSPVMTCREPACLNVAHMRLLTTRQIAQLAAREGRFSTVQRRAAVAAGIRAAGRPLKLDTAALQVILASSDPTRTLAERFGVSHSYITRVRQRGTATCIAKAGMPGSSVFSWLPSSMSSQPRKQGTSA